MLFSNLNYIFSWWAVLFFIGIIFLPFTTIIFSNFFDRGYIFSKVLGMLIISFLVFLLGSLKIIPFTQLTIITVIAIIMAITLVKVPPWSRWNLFKSCWRIFLFEELLFLLTLVFWSYIRAHEPSIHGLEKYMDFGFVNSILRTDWFPAKDMWYPPSPINYYYFGHIVTAILTKLSGIDSTITYNLMIATLFALTFTGSFSIGSNLIAQIKLNAKRSTIYAVAAGLLIAFLVSFAGNLHTIYAFFKPYIPADNPIPFWQLPFSLSTLYNDYWYPNATRFIPFTIHEFPIYSFVVSDLHGHVLSIPIVLTIIALLLNILMSKSLNIFKSILLAFLIAIAYMTNAWDGLIYGGLTFLVLFYLAYKSNNLVLYSIRYTLILIGSIIFTLPFSLFFKPFATGIGVLCAPKFLIDLGKVGPFLFEPNHCQRSPFWQLTILYGFFYFFVVLFIFFLFRNFNLQLKNLTTSDIFILLLISLSTLLILIPEFFYIKDIYPAHYRANTMFKLGYQAFMMLSIACGYIIVKLIHNLELKIQNWKLVVLAPMVIGVGSIGLLLVGMYPLFSINSYYGGLKNYKGLDGLTYLRDLYPTDYEAILWLRKNIKGQPVILEANGESYTDFARISSNTGLPTVIGWPVHEWLWRGSYDVAAPRITDVQTIYENTDINLIKQLLKKSNVSLIFVGDLERQKYQNINEDNFRQLGRIIFESKQTRVYQLSF